MTGNHPKAVVMPFALLFVVVSICGCMLFTPVLASSVVSQKLDLQYRFDTRSDRPSRHQYRVRYYPSLSFGDQRHWSLNGFIVSGDDFASSHNTLGSDNADYLYARRVFVRYQSDYGKTEIGVIPTYKGRVSSTGLSKDGWITGIRNVFQLQDDSAFEVVVGQLSDTQANRALSLGGEEDYVEIEYSANMGKKHSYEASIERMTAQNFIRGEYRYQITPSHTAFFEAIKRLDDASAKIVVGLSGSLSLYHYPLEYFSHYSHVDDDFGARAELTEDFLGTGHGVSLEVSGDLVRHHHLEWFSRIDVVDSVTRVMAGIKLSLAQN